MSMSPTQASQPRNTLDGGQKYKVIEWLRAHWSKIENTRPTKQMVVSQMTVGLGYVVTLANLQHALKMIGKRFPVPDKHLTPEKVEDAIRDSKLKGRVDMIEAKLTGIASSLIHLLNELGAEVPVDLADVIADDDEVN